MHFFRLLILAALLPGSPASAQQNLREGDIVFQDSQSPQCEAIRRATHSPWSHCGILYRADNGAWMVLEAVQPVSVTTLELWKLRNKQSFAVKRLKNGENILTAEVIDKMKSEAEPYIGKNYDIYFNWSDAEIYCSELVWKIYHTVGIDLCELKPLRSYDLSHPIVKATMEKRYGKNAPFSEKMVSPGDLFNSSLLESVPTK
ncbi:YiiX family permuted papain-like enzyme [Chitinophaga caseinilytica]|uniref:YiiX family permuted papain-like enzyme n=1 Tax=Chitinophaga caseinilytica TaxID=2267521 RepID=A0ABZ2Z5E9_9BACT